MVPEEKVPPQRPPVHGLRRSDEEGSSLTMVINVTGYRSYSAAGVRDTGPLPGGWTGREQGPNTERENGHT
jgi:hypothetical protein